jgi:hypothetical protein
MSNPRWVTTHGKRILVETFDATPRQKKSEAKRQEEFAKVPLLWAAEVAKRTRTRDAMVWILLLHTAWKNRSTTFPFSNVMPARHGVSRYTKYRMLRKLEATGLIQVEWRYKQSPIVTLVLIPKMKIT